MKDIIKGLGILTNDPDVKGWMRSADITIPFFDGKEVPFIITIEDDWGKEFLDEHEAELEEKMTAAVDAFLKLDAVYREKVSPLVYEDYKKTLTLVDIEPLNIKSGSDVWQFVHPEAVHITYRDRNNEKSDSKNDKLIYLQVFCKCHWEEEHGLVFVFKNGNQLVRISEYDGHLTEAEAYAIPDSEDKLLSNPIK